MFKGFVYKKASSTIECVNVGYTITKSVHAWIQVSSWPATLQISAGFRRRIYDWSKARPLSFGVSERWQHVECSSSAIAALCFAVCVTHHCFLAVCLFLLTVNANSTYTAVMTFDVLKQIWTASAVN